MEISHFLFSWFLITLIFYAGSFFFAIRWGLHEQQYFLGYGRKLFDITLFNIKFSVGFYLPLAGLFRIYRIEEDQKLRWRHYWEFFDHPLWKRFFVTIGSILSLTLASVIIYGAMAYVEEEPNITKAEVNRLGIYPSALAAESGLQRGDKIVRINGRDYERYSDLVDPYHLLKGGSMYTILREGTEIDVTLNPFTLEDFSELEMPYISLLAPFEIRKVLPGTPAESAGIMPGDMIAKVNDQPVIKIYDFEKALREDDDGRVILEVIRQSETIKTEMTVETGYFTGFYIEEKINYEIKRNSLGESIQQGFVKPFAVVKAQVTTFFKIMSGSLVFKESHPIRGPIGMTNNPARHPWKRFWQVTGVLCIVTAFLNLLPLPNTVFWKAIPLLYETITRKEYPYRAYKATRIIGMIIVVLFMVWIFLVDIINLVM